ncbi:MAG: hypothetical protein IRY89_16740 [Pseudolabrys sp.]|nr:hypothetical protein [Pseudolabrys sp.]
MPARRSPDSSDSSAAAHLDEIAAILALGVLRLLDPHPRQNMNDINGLGDFPLDFPAKESVCRHEPAQGREV